MVSRRCRDTVTSDTWTGAVMPELGRISTVPSILGYSTSQREGRSTRAAEGEEHTTVAEMPG